jgi:hypothetical protein
MGFSSMPRRSQAQATFAAAVMACTVATLAYFHFAPSPIASAVMSASAPALPAATRQASAAAAAQSATVSTMKPLAATAPIAASTPVVAAVAASESPATPAPVLAAPGAVPAAPVAEDSAKGAGACLELGPMPQATFEKARAELAADPKLRNLAVVREIRYPAVWSVRFSYRSAYEKAQIMKTLAARKLQPAEVTKPDVEGAGLVVMGYFPSEDKAQVVNAALARMGVNDQVIGEVQPERVDSSFVFPNPSDETLAAMKPYWTDLEITPRAIACPGSMPRTRPAGQY